MTNVKKSLLNTVWGLVYQLVVIGFGLILPRLFIVSYGSEMNGLMSSVTQIYTYVALLEAGVGAASLQALYKTVAKNDYDGTNGILAATDHFYKRTGLFYLVSVLGISVLYPLVVESEISKSVVFLVILLNGLGGVINYFFQGKYRILLQAEGKSYVLSNLSTATYLLTSFSKIVIIYLGFNVVVIQSIYFLINILQMLFIVIYVKKKYNWINLQENPNYDAISQKNSVLVHQIAQLVFSNTDVLILTFARGLREVSVYTLFINFYNMVKSILFSFLDGIKFMLGQKYHQDRIQFIALYDIFEVYYMALTFAMYTVLHIFIMPFMSLYTKGISDINYLDFKLAFLFTMIFLLQGARGPSALVIDIAGHFKQTQKRAILEAVINLSISLLCVWKYGMYGLLFGTIVALLYRANDIVIYVNRHILKRSLFITYKRWGVNFIIFVGINILYRHINVLFESYFKLIITAIPSAVLILLIYFGFNSLTNLKDLKNVISMIKKK